MLDRRHVLIAGAAAAALPAHAMDSDLIYANPLSKPSDIANWKMEGEASVDFDTGRMRLKNKLAPDQGQASNFVFWNPKVFEGDVAITWKFRPLVEPGLAILFFAAGGVDGQHILAPSLKPRAGIYDQYTQSDVAALQIAYFRRRWPEERAFHVSNLRRAPGFELLAQGADPLPDIADMTREPYRMKLVKTTAGVIFSINDLTVLTWADDSKKPTPRKGSVGFRQMAPLEAVYSDLEVRRLIGPA
ncbi:hypothetical protein ABAC460_00795 [Asticcacaulis sp. AC460]|uniref:DUF1961 family protein n=1 Tax=Asticcacaulis sp. AC460 TaxID=1282360 RepID=UPI0003C3DC1F|nr:DUF1961 family protein [Asticcacaulis sp. AC460]ESQ93270.1 hypothetical protein ABAC460_00795 [Asticcacaulis sp. AC460]